DDRGLEHRSVLVQDALDLGAGDVLTARDDQVLQPVDDEEVAVGVAHADVAGVEPPARERGRGRVGVAPVAGEHLRAPQHDLPGVSGGWARPPSSQTSSSRYGHGRPTLPSLEIRWSRSRNVSPETVSVSP